MYSLAMDSPANNMEKSIQRQTLPEEFIFIPMQNSLRLKPSVLGSKWLRFRYRLESRDVLLQHLLSKHPRKETILQNYEKAMMGMLM